jgi:hypothetical protein
MHHGENGVRKRMAKPAFELGREADLWHQHQRLPAALEHPRDEVEVDLGLAAAGHAVKEERLEAAERSLGRFKNPPLRLGERMGGEEARGCFAAGSGERFARQRLHRSQARRQRADDGFAERPLVVAGKKAHQLEPIRRQRRRVLAHGADSFHAADREIGLRVRVDDDAELRARAERNDDAIAHLGARVARLRIIEELRQRHVERHSHARNFAAG